MDEWVYNFKSICHIDSFDGRHPNVFVPARAAHDEFTSIEDINNYLLHHPDVVDYIKVRGEKCGKPVAVFLMFDEKTEELCDDLGLDIWFPPAKLRHRCDNKVETVRIGEKAGVPSVPNALAKVKSYQKLRAVAKQRRPRQGPRRADRLRRLGPHHVLHLHARTTGSGTPPRSRPSRK